MSNKLPRITPHCFENTVILLHPWECNGRDIVDAEGCKLGVLVRWQSRTQGFKSYQVRQSRFGPRDESEIMSVCSDDWRETLQDFVRRMEKKK